MRIYITGCPGSGKTTLAGRVSEITGDICVSLDEVQYERDPQNPGDNRRRPDAARDAMFNEIITRRNWIIEDAGRECFRAGQEMADVVAALDAAKPRLLWRVTRRWLRQRRGIERAQYRPDGKMLRLMWKWVLEYRLRDHLYRPENTVILKNRRDADAFLNGLRKKPQ